MVAAVASGMGERQPLQAGHADPFPAVRRHSIRGGDAVPGQVATDEFYSVNGFERPAVSHAGFVPGTV